MNRRISVSAFLVLAFLVMGPARAGWQAPADNKLTEDQVRVYLATTNDWLDDYARMMHDLEGAQTEVARLAAVGDIDKRHEACLSRHNISPEEYSWVAQRTMEAWGVAAYVNDVYAKSETDLQARIKKSDARLAEAQQRLADYQAALKDGARVLTAEDRQAAIKSATADQQAAMDDAKQHADEARAALEEAKQRDADAVAIDVLVATPPADISAEDRPSYIDGKKGEALAARDAAKEARDRAAEATRAMNDSQAKATLAAARAAHSEIPATDEERAKVKSENEAAIAEAEKEINQCDQNKTKLAIVEAQSKKQVDEMGKSVPPENVALMQKYSAEYKKTSEREALGGASTLPSGN